MQPFSRMLTYFVEVARQGSVRKASEHLNVSASAIDRQILAAEEEMGVPLFNRLPGGMRLTTAGEFLLRGALDWQKDFTRISGQIDDLSGLRRGQVRLAVIEALAHGFLLRIISTMRTQYPGIAVDICVLPNDRIAETVARGSVDLGLLLNPQSSRDITVRAFRQIPIGVVMPRGHPLQSAKTLQFSQLSEENVIRPVDPLEIAEQFRVLEVATGLRISAALSSNNIALIRSLITQGNGVSVLSQLDVAEESNDGRLCFVPLAEPALRPTTLAVCHARHGQISSAAALCLRFIEEQKSWTA